jgi:saccharopine dehydrogenase-like NADP-dependent oxidoreductase
VLVLGGYGNFGAPIASRLAADNSFEVVVAGRDASKAAGFARTIGAQAAAIDIDDSGFATALRAAAPDLVVSTAGPFQGQDYKVARAALAARAHYIDIADGRAFVCGITALDAEARAAGRLVVAGASSVPALSSAVIDHLARDLDRVDKIDIGISASERVPGLATMSAVLGYCGKPFTQWRDGEWRTVHGWQSVRRHDFSSPPMRRWIADCDVPDLEILPARWPGVRAVRFGAGVESRFIMVGIWKLSWLVRAGLMANAARYAELLARAARLLERFGSGRSAMFVQVTGMRHGQSADRRWEMRAERNEGVLVPCLAAVALARKLARGELEPGATPCVGLITLEEYLREAGGLAVTAAIIG